MWVTPRKEQLTKLEKQIEDLVEGEIFSINKKSKKFVLTSIDPFEKNQVVAHELLSSNKIGDQTILPYGEYKHRFVTVWGEIEEEKEERPCQELDRVQSPSLNVEGTVLIVNGSNAKVLWDTIINGSWITSVASNTLNYMGIKATGKLLVRAQEAKPMARDIEEEEKRIDADVNGAQELVQQALDNKTQEIQRRKDVVAKENQGRIDALAKKIINDNADEFKRMIEAAVLTVTAGPHNYELGMIANIVDGHRDRIFTLVCNSTTNIDVRIPVTVSVMKEMSSVATTDYLLTREGFVVNRDNGWEAITKRGTSLGTWKIKGRATSKIHRLEYRKRHGMEE